MAKTELRPSVTKSIEGPLLPGRKEASLEGWAPRPETGTAVGHRRPVALPRCGPSPNIGDQPSDVGEPRIRTAGFPRDRAGPRRASLVRGAAVTPVRVTVCVRGKGCILRNRGVTLPVTQGSAGTWAASLSPETNELHSAVMSVM